MTEIRARIHTTDGLEYTTTMDSSDIDHLTTEEQTAVLTKLARELHGRGLNVANLNVDRIDIVETSWTPWSTDITATPSPSMFTGVARLFAPAGAAAVVPPTAVAAPVAALPMSPAVEGGVTEFIREGGRLVPRVLTPRNQENIGGQVYDIYEAPGASGGTERWRRLHEGAPRPWEVNRGGSWGAASVAPPALADIVRTRPAGWEMSVEGNTTVYTESAGAHRRIRVSNAFDGIVQIGTENPADHTFTYRDVTSADGALPNFPHLPLGAATAEVRDGSRRVAVTSATTDRFITEGEGTHRVRWEVMVAPGATADAPPIRYRRRVDEFGTPLTDAGWQKFHPNAGGSGGTYRNVGAPGAVGGGGVHRVATPARVWR